jgi:hypothetical protein
LLRTGECSANGSLRSGTFVLIAIGRLLLLFLSRSYYLPISSYARWSTGPSTGNGSRACSRCTLCAVTSAVRVPPCLNSYGFFLHMFSPIGIVAGYSCSAARDHRRRDAGSERQLSRPPRDCCHRWTRYVRFSSFHITITVNEFQSVLLLARKGCCRAWRSA